MRLRHHTAGFSLLELMIVVTIVGILAAVAIPSFGELIQNNRRTTVVNEVLTNLMLARTEAAKRGQPVTVCGNTSGGGISCTGGTNWNYGWMIFLDPNGDGAIAATSDMLRQYVNDYPDIKITAPDDGALVMRPFNLKSDNGTITICDKRGSAQARAVIVANTGRAQVSNKQSDGSTALNCP